MAAKTQEIQHLREQLVHLQLKIADLSTQNAQLTEHNNELTLKLAKLSSKSIFHLMDLPLELRVEIYRLSLAAPFTITSQHLLAYINGNRRGFPGLLTANLALRAEAFQAFVEVNTLDITGFDDVFGGITHRCQDYITARGCGFDFVRSVRAVVVRIDGRWHVGPDGLARLEWRTCDAAFWTLFDNKAGGRVKEITLHWNIDVLKDPVLQLDETGTMCCEALLGLLDGKALRTIRLAPRYNRRKVVFIDSNLAKLVRDLRNVVKARGLDVNIFDEFSKSHA